MHLVEGAGPEAVADGFVGVFDKALVKEERPGKAAMNNGGLSTAFQYGSDAVEVEHGFCAWNNSIVGQPHRLARLSIVGQAHCLPDLPFPRTAQGSGDAALASPASLPGRKTGLQIVYDI